MITIVKSKLQPTRCVLGHANGRRPERTGVRRRDRVVFPGGRHAAPCPALRIGRPLNGKRPGSESSCGRRLDQQATAGHVWSERDQNAAFARGGRAPTIKLPSSLATDRADANRQIWGGRNPNSPSPVRSSRVRRSSGTCRDQSSRIRHKADEVRRVPGDVRGPHRGRIGEAAERPCLAAEQAVERRTDGRLRARADLVTCPANPEGCLAGCDVLRLRSSRREKEGDEKNRSQVRSPRLRSAIANRAQPGAAPPISTPGRRAGRRGPPSSPRSPPARRRSPRGRRT